MKKMLALIAACVHTPITQSHAFDRCDYCEGCHWCGLREEDHEGAG